MCASHLKTVLRRVFLCLISENSLCPLAVCCLFQRTVNIFLVPFKEIRFYTVGIRTSAVCLTVFVSPHRFASTDELKSRGNFFCQSKTLVEVQIVISVIPGTK